MEELECSPISSVRINCLFSFNGVLCLWHKREKCFVFRGISEQRLLHSFAVENICEWVVCSGALLDDLFAVSRVSPCIECIESKQKCFFTSSVFFSVKSSVTLCCKSNKQEQQGKAKRRRKSVGNILEVVVIFGFRPKQRTKVNISRTNVVNLREKCKLKFA